MPRKQNKGFTLLEILLVIATIGILAAIVLVAINPNRQLAQARNAVRQADINTIQKAVEQYLIDTGSYPNSINTNFKEICNTGSQKSTDTLSPTTLCDNKADLRELVPTYVASIPADPSGGVYIIRINTENNRIGIIARGAESGQSIAINSFDFFNPANIGLPVGGGYFAGLISHTADGNPTHALIVAPRVMGATGSSYTLTTNLAWKTTATATAGTTSIFDGTANTVAMVAAGIADHPAAQFCVGLNIGGFTDWYLPALYELDIAYFNLKPGTAVNNTGFGINNYSVPKRTANNTASYPTRTSITAFNNSIEAFTADFHWSSTELNASSAWTLNFFNGVQNNPIKTSGNSVRAFRRIAL